MSRSQDMVPYKQIQTEVVSSIYNLWKRAKSRINMPFRFPLSGLQGLVMIIDKDEWLCANEQQYDLPVICWYNFQDKDRLEIHQPVKCKQNLYHFAAHKISEQVLQKMQMELEKRLNKKQP